MKERIQIAFRRYWIEFTIGGAVAGFIASWLGIGGCVTAVPAWLLGIMGFITAILFWVGIAVLPGGALYQKWAKWGTFETEREIVPKVRRESGKIWVCLRKLSRIVYGLLLVPLRAEAYLC